MIYIGTISTIHLNQEGLPVCAVIDSADNYYYPCSSLCATGGYDGVFSSPSLRVGAQVAIIANNNPGSAFYIIGGVADARDALTVGVDGVDTAYAAEQSTGSTDVSAVRTFAAQNVDYNDVHLEDYHVENTDNFLNLGENGITLSSENRVSVQIPTTGLFRVSSAGVANNQILNGVPFLDVLFSLLIALKSKQDFLVADKLVTLNAQLVAAPDPASKAAIQLQIDTLNAIVVPDPLVTKTEATSTLNDKVRVP